MTCFDSHLGVVRQCVVQQGRLFTASADGTLKCWEAETGKCLYTVTGQGPAVCCASLHGSMAFTGSSDGNVRQFRLDDRNIAEDTVTHAAVMATP